MANDHAADRPHQITDREDAECRKQLGDRILMREEVAAYLCCEVAIDRKIVPFEYVADHSGRSHPAHVREVHLAPKAVRPVSSQRGIARQPMTSDRLVIMSPDGHEHRTVKRHLLRFPPAPNAGLPPPRAPACSLRRRGPAGGEGKRG